MARATGNRQVQQRDNNLHTDDLTNAQAIESALARYDQIGVFRKANVAASSVAVALTLGGVDSDALGGFVAGRKGVITGIVWNWSTVPTAGTVSLQASVAGTAAGDVVSVLAVKGVGDYAATEIAFNEGDVLALAITSNAGFLPVTADIEAWLMIRWIPA